MWVARRRARYRDRAGPLPEATRAALAAFFPTPTLDAARLAVVPRIPGPPFLSLLRKAGLVAADFRRVVGMTFQDTIIVTEDLAGPALQATLFHELVHVEQARQLGLAGFARRYVEGWLEEGRYDRIPLERDAYELQRRFERAPGVPFDVFAEVSARSVRVEGAGACDFSSRATR